MSSSPNDEDKFIDPLELLGEAPSPPPKPRVPPAGAAAGRATPAERRPVGDVQPYDVAPTAPSQPAPAARGAGHVPQRDHPYPPPPLRSATQAAEPVSYHCLNCGYRLLPQTDYRCAECGRQHDLETLENWFAGDEEERFTHALWGACAAVILTMMAIAELRTVAMVGTSVAGAWAGFRAIAGKYRSLSKALGIGAGCCALATIFTCATPEGTRVGYYTLQMVSAALLVASLLTDSESRGILGARGFRQFALFLACLAPAMFIALTVTVRFTIAGNPTVANALGTSAGPDWQAIIGIFVPQAIAGLYWLFAAWAIWSARRTLFAKPVEVDADAEE